MGSALSTSEASHTMELASDTISSYPSRIEGVRQLHALIAHRLGMEVEPSLAPAEALDRDAQARGSLTYD